jgi:hypothetical protein
LLQTIRDLLVFVNAVCAVIKHMSMTGIENHIQWFK